MASAFPGMDLVAPSRSTYQIGTAMPVAGRSTLSSFLRLERVTLWIGILSLLIADATAADFDLFERGVRPVLVGRCANCHRLTAKPAGTLPLLDTPDGLRGTIVPGEPQRSRLVIGSLDPVPDGGVPLPAQCRLSPSELPGFAAWIQAGAADPRGIPDGPTHPRPPTSDHWAFRQPIHPRQPPVRDTGWPQTPVDRFILAALESRGLKPSAPADRRTLLRRATLDLTGLPPSPEACEGFLRDDSPDAFARVVDRLLDSPAYGERWGRHWLDVARYSDTKGYVFYYEESQFVQPHHYRDWVVDALNRDLPYDRFLELQIAADQLAGNRNPRPETIRATTVDPDDAGGVPDIAAMGFLTLGRRFLGNPHDIIDDQLDVVIRGTQALTIGCARCHDHKFDPIPTADYYALYGVFHSSRERLVPLIPPPSPDSATTFAQAREYIEFQRELQARVQKLETAFGAACDQVADRLRSKSAEYLKRVVHRDSLGAVTANVRPAPDDINPFNVRQWDGYLTEKRAAFHPVFTPLFAFMDLAGGAWERESPALARRFATTNIPGPAINPRVAGLFNPAPTSLEEVAERYGRLLATIHQEWRAALEKARSAKTPAPTALPDPAAEELRHVLYGLDAPVLAPAGSIVELDVHLYFDDPNRVALSRLQMEIEQWVNAAPGAPPHALVLTDRPTLSNGRIFKRGDPAKPQEEVPHRFLQAVSGTRNTAFLGGSGRLELARAITDPRNPLTARVMVNRVWMHHFGTGLVATPSDFGVRSEPPSHPELLDWLACCFVDDKWSLKALHRRILLSSTYQQSAIPNGDPATVDRVDPGNRLLGHFPRQRLDFEVLRDSMLAASGELDLNSGGRSFDLETKPIIPRRTLYGRVDRKFVPAALRAFDFANPDAHVPQRHTTTVPQQALYLLNSDWIMDRAKAVAQRVDPDGRAAISSDLVTRLYRRIHQRPPTDHECALGLAFLNGGGIAPNSTLPPLAQYAQVLLFSNEFSFVE